MIWTPLTTVMVVLGLFGLALVLFASTKAYGISRRISTATLEGKYQLEKDFYLLSTVVWVVLISRIAATGLFWVTNESLIPLIPGAMCQYGVYQAGTPYSWLDNGVKLVVLLVYGIWLTLDLINRAAKGAPLSKSLSRLFLLITPLLFLDTGLDLAFYSSLVPVVVPCCRIVFTAESTLPCPYCFIFHDAPLFLIVVASYGISLALVVWGLAVTYYSKKDARVESVSMPVLRKLILISLAFAVIGTIALVPAIIQVMAPIT